MLYYLWKNHSLLFVQIILLKIQEFKKTSIITIMANIFYKTESVVIKIFATLVFLNS